MAIICYDVDNLILYHLNVFEICNLIQTSKYWRKRMGWYMDCAKNCPDTLDDQFLKACDNRNLKMAKWLWEKGVWLEQEIDFGKALSRITKSDNYDFIEWLCFKASCSNYINPEGFQPIHYVCRYSRPQIIMRILDNNLDLECSTNNGWRPIHFICRYSRPCAIKHIIDKGVNLECQTKQKAQPIHIICHNSTPEMIKYIIDKGVDLESADERGWRPIHIICRFSTTEMMKYIINKGVNLKCLTNYGVDSNFLVDYNPYINYFDKKKIKEMIQEKIETMEYLLGS